MVCLSSVSIYCYTTMGMFFRTKSCCRALATDQWIVMVLCLMLVQKYIAYARFRQALFCPSQKCFIYVNLLLNPTKKGCKNGQVTKWSSFIYPSSDLQKILAKHTVTSSRQILLTENIRPSRVSATEWVPPHDTCKHGEWALFLKLEKKIVQPLQGN